MLGTVKWFEDQKGYGFITGNDGSSYFAHHSHIDDTGFRSLDAGQTVEFVPSTISGSMSATHIKKIAIPQIQTSPKPTYEELAAIIREINLLGIVVKKSDGLVCDEMQKKVRNAALGMDGVARANEDAEQWDML